MEHITTGRSWSSELRTFLIRAIKPREKLWRKGGGVHDSDTRMTLWTEVQEVINKEYDIYIEIDEIKKTWKNLKDNFLRVKKAENSTIPGKRPNTKKWFFLDELQFLEYADQGNDYRHHFQSLAPDLETEITVEPLKKKFKRENEHYVISIPSIDDKIHTKQKTPLGALILKVDDDIEEIAKLTQGKWDFNLPKSKATTPTHVDPTASISNFTHCIFEEKPILHSTEPRKARISPNLIQKLSAAIPAMRADFQKAATVYLRMNCIPTRKHKKSLNDFDNFIYCDMPVTDDMKQIIKICDRETQIEFEQLFYLVNKYRAMLDLENGASEKPAGTTMKPNTRAQKMNMDWSEESHLEDGEEKRKVQRMLEIHRDVDRINTELGGQPSVIRKTKLKKTLAELQKELSHLTSKQEVTEPMLEEFLNKF